MITWNFMLSKMNLWEVGFYDKDDWICIGHFKHRSDAEKKAAEYNSYERKKHIDAMISEKVRGLSNG